MQAAVQKRGTAGVRTGVAEHEVYGNDDYQRFRVRCRATLRAENDSCDRRDPNFILHRLTSSPCLVVATSSVRITSNIVVVIAHFH